MQVNIETEPDTSIPTVTLHVPVDYPETAALTAALKNLSIEAATLTVSQRGQLVQLPLTSIYSSKQLVTRSPPIRWIMFIVFPSR